MSKVNDPCMEGMKFQLPFILDITTSLANSVASLCLELQNYEFY